MYTRILYTRKEIHIDSQKVFGGVWMHVSDLKHVEQANNDDDDDDDDDDDAQYNSWTAYIW